MNQYYCRGQCYDGALNISGACKGVVKLINQEKGCAINTFCHT